MKESTWDWNSNEIGRMKDHQHFVVHCEIINKVQFKWNGVNVLLKGAGNFNCNCNCDENGKTNRDIAYLIHCYSWLLFQQHSSNSNKKNDYGKWKRKWRSMKRRECIQHIQKFWMFRVHPLVVSNFITWITRSTVILLFSAIRCTCMIIITLELYSLFFDNSLNEHKILNELQRQRQLFSLNVLIALLHVMLYHFISMIVYLSISFS